MRYNVRSVEERFWTRVEKTPTCWLWIGGVNEWGYGEISINYGTSYVHRWSWEQVNGPIPNGQTIDHLCAVKICVNPNHMELVTPSENLRRRWAREIKF